MALPLAPIAAFSLKYGSVALATYWASRQLHQAPREQPVEDALDKVDEGLALRKDSEQANVTARWRRIFWIKGQGVEVDATALARIRFRKVKAK